MIFIRLFSVFDPCSYFGLSINWLIIIIILIMGFWGYYYISGGYTLFLKKLGLEVRGVFKEISSPHFKGIEFFTRFVFVFLITGNLFGLFPFVFTCTAHPIIRIRIGVVLWLSFFLIGWLKSFKSSAAHLVPEGRPLFLSPLIVIIERISHLIRPFTLSIRLAANIMAGHLIVGLLAMIRGINFIGFFCSVFIQSVLLVLEVGVCIIQGFVFRILLLLYAIEYY